jgi:GT2 family glycosyltransferase
MRSVDVVIPVYQGYPETLACVTSVMRTVDDHWARVIIINDCSPDPQITDYLRQLKAHSPQLILLENEKNLGFVATVNRGMSFDVTRDVLLLNSDVEVAGDWLRRLREAAYHHELVASVTPFSNNATICSFPNICKNNNLMFALPLADIDALFAAEFTVADAFQVPTGVGCCMYLRRDCLNQIGYFDQAAFGRGYGEENDWCQRAAQAGWRNFHVANCFVYHKGGVSFGEEYSPRLAHALNTLDRKYPRYHSDIQRFISRDPARAARVRAWLRLFAAQKKPKVLMISHKLSGGVQQHVDELATVFADRALFLFMMPDQDGHSVRLSCCDGDERLRDGLFFNIDTEYRKLLELLIGLGISRVHFHHTMGLPTRLWKLAEDLGCEYDLTIHDYYLVNGNPSLTDKEGRYVSDSDPRFDELCAGHRPLPEGYDADLWRKNQKMIVEDAARVIFPSLDCSNRFRKFFNVRNAVVAWHPDYTNSAPYPAPQWHFPTDRPLRVLVLGALSKEKGADVLENVAAALLGENIVFHLLGYAYKRLGSGVVSHEPYDNKDIFKLIDGVNPDVVWFPAMWPETYSYTLSIALHRGVPIVAPNIGAFVERVQGRPHTAVVDWNSSITQWRSFWMTVLQDKALPDSSDYPPANIDSDAASRTFYAMEYIQATAVKETIPDPEVFRNLGPNLYVHSVKLSWSEQLLKRIWRFSRRPLGAVLISTVPFKVQRAIKRYLSHRPMHDIVGK